MNQNPYKYKGPLDPAEDELVCIPRRADVCKVVEGINRGYYWAVLGPRQTGKTTFLRLVQKEFERNEFPNPYLIYFNFGVSPSNEKEFYRLLMNTFLDKITSGLEKNFINGLTDDSPAFRFTEFLEKFKPKDNNRKIVLLLDEIGNRPFIKDFLLVWKWVYDDRYRKENLNRYAIIAAGSGDLIALTTGPTSPFNVAEPLYLKDFSDDESERLIVNPMAQLNIEIEPKARENVMSQVSGHPQILQQICHILVEMVSDQKRTITEADVKDAVNTIFKENLTLDTLKQDITNDRILKNLVREILKGEKKVYYTRKIYSISGVGAIVDDKNFCAIRNRIYEKFFRDFLETLPQSNSKEYELMDSSPSNSKAGVTHFDALLLCNHTDIQQVERIGKNLKKHGLKIWLDRWNMQAGRAVTDEINDIFSSIHSVLLFVGEEELAAWDDHELRALLRKFKNEKVPIIPVILPHVKYVPEILPFLEDIVPIDFREKESDPFIKLVTAITERDSDDNV